MKRMKPLFCTMLLGLTISDVVWANTSERVIPIPTQSEIAEMDKEYIKIEKIKNELLGIEEIINYKRNNKGYLMNGKSFRQYVSDGYYYKSLMPILDKIEIKYGDKSWQTLSSLYGELHNDWFRRAFWLLKKGYEKAYEQLFLSEKTDEELHEEFITFSLDIANGLIKTNNKNILQRANSFAARIHMNGNDRPENKSLAKKYFRKSCELSGIPNYKNFNDIPGSNTEKQLKVIMSGCREFVTLTEEGY